MPLPMPHQLSSHTVMDFFTDLPESQANPTIADITDCFSCLIRLITLPSSFGLAELMFHHMFCYFGIPEVIVSDYGPQFTSHVLGGESYL